MPGNAIETAEVDRLRAVQLEIVNEVARRVHLVLCNFAQVRARGQSMEVSPAESQAIINGAVSGIAVLVSRMAITNSGASDDKRSPEEYFGDMIKEQFIGVYRETQQLDAAVALKAGAPVS